MDLQISEKILRYEEFLNDHLKEDLKKVHQKRDFINTEISEYFLLKHSLETIADINTSEEEEGFKTKMDIGCGFYVQANVTDSSRVFVDVGLGYFVEFTTKEALQFIDVRVKLLLSNTEKLTKEIARINGMIKLMLGGLAELQKAV